MSELDSGRWTMTNVNQTETNVIPLDDSREKLEADVLKLSKEWNKNTSFWSIYTTVGYAQIIDLLDRQDAITQRECIDRWDDKALALYADAETARKALAEECEEWERICDKVKAERDDLQAKVDELTEVRDELLEQVERYAEEAANFEQQLADAGKTHMRLPVDADGVPIHLGDLLVRENGDEHYCHGIGKSSLDVMDEHCSWWRSDCFRHVQPDTVESLLEEFYGKTHATTAEEREELAAEYAERIRKACQ